MISLCASTAERLHISGRDVDEIGLPQLMSFIYIAFQTRKYIEYILIMYSESQILVCIQLYWDMIVWKISSRLWIK